MGGVATGAWVRDIDSLIEDAFSGRDLTAEEVQAIAEHVAAAGFDPIYMVSAGKRLEGVAWQGQILARNTELPTAEVHYLRHVIEGAEWPARTTLDEYQASVAVMARSMKSGVAVGTYNGRQMISLVGRTGAQRGPRGANWMLVEYRVRTRHWSTAFQIREGLPYLEDDEARKDLRWIRTP